MDSMTQTTDERNSFDDDHMEAVAARPDPSPKKKSKMKLIAVTEKDLALHLIEKARAAGTPLSFSEGSFWSYDHARGVWAYASREAVGRQVSALHGTRVKMGPAISEINATIKLIDAVTKQLALLLADDDFFAPAAGPVRLAFLNGVLEVTAAGAKLLSHSPSYRLREAIALDWVPGLPINADWLQHLTILFGGGGEEIEYLRRVIAASIAGIATRFSKSSWVYGGGSNGKSVIKLVIEAVAPQSTSPRRKTCVAVAPQLMTDPQHRLHFASALVNCVGECPRRDMSESEAFKDLIDGKSEMTAKALYSDQFWFRPRAGHFFLVNNLPHVADLSHGAWRRIVLLETTATFGGEGGREEVIDWHRRITDSPAALQSILCWLVEGLVGLLRDGALKEPDSSLKAKAAWRQDCDQVAQFISEELTIEPFTAGKRSGFKASDLYGRYAKWAKENGFSHALTSKAFGQRMIANKIAKKDYSDGAYYAVTAKIGYGDEEATLFDEAATALDGGR